MTDDKSQTDAPVPINGFDHVAIAVPDLDAAMAFYQERFGCEVTEPVIVETQLVRMA